ncbi:MAG: alpha/beta fold hydrolase, partial [Candidatus Marinimicrobia bacterium]|nr:alpha/beta fold hydrolase [Candidatus Neomarinimicrobiota bacterium]
NSQYKLLTDILDIQHVHAVIGGSMGGMQTFNWVVEYPDFMDKAVSWVGSPRATASDRLSWTLKMRMIDEGEKYGQPDSVIMKNVNLLQNMIVYSPEFRSLETAYEEFPQFLANIPNKFGATYCMGNYRWQLEAMSTNNITAKFNNSYDDVAKHIKAKMLIIVNKQDHIVSPIPSLQLAKTLKAKTLILDNNRGHLGISPEMKKVSKTIHRFLK